MIYVECYPDLALVKSLTRVTRRGVTHEFRGKGAICNQLRKHNNCIGLLDEDPLSAQPSYIKDATLVNDLSEHEIKVLHDSTNNNYLIVLCPRLEEWILKASQEAGKDVRKYNMPNNAVKLHKEINITLNKFENLLKDLKNSSIRLKTLEKLLKARHE